MSSGSLILALGDGARSTVVSSFQISRSRRWIQSEIRGEFSLFSSPVLYRYLPLAPLFNMKKTTWCCLIDFHLFTTVFDLWSPRARVCTDRCSCCNLVQDLIAVWVVDYIGGGTRHMSPEELDCTAMEPSHVSVGSGRKDSIEIPHVQRHKRERKWFCLSVERVSTLSWTERWLQDSRQRSREFDLLGDYPSMTVTRESETRPVRGLGFNHTHRYNKHDWSWKSGGSNHVLSSESGTTSRSRVGLYVVVIGCSCRSHGEVRHWKYYRKSHSDSVSLGVCRVVVFVCKGWRLCGVTMLLCGKPNLRQSRVLIVAVCGTSCWSRSRTTFCRRRWPSPARRTSPVSIAS